MQRRNGNKKSKKRIKDNRLIPGYPKSIAKPLALPTPDENDYL